LKEGAGAIGAGRWLWVFHGFFLDRRDERVRQMCRFLSPGARDLMGRRCGTKSGAGCEEPFSGLRHTSTKRAMKHAVRAALVRRLGRIKQVSRFLFGEEKLCGSYPLKETHGSMAMWALPQRRLREEGCFLRRRLVEQSAAEWQHAGSSAVGEEAEVADTGKAPWQHMLYESAQELLGGECKFTLPAVVGIVLPAEADLSR